MSIEELGNREIELYNIVSSLQGTMEEKDKQVRDLGIYEEYGNIHAQYAKLCRRDLEALKRGLFLLWYSKAEPSCYTGIGELQLKFEREIIKVLDRRLNKRVSDYELDWMLSYYKEWDYIFDRFEVYQVFYSIVKSPYKTELPNSIRKEEMSKRGQMGIYWNSLELFTD